MNISMKVSSTEVSIPMTVSSTFEFAEFEYYDGEYTVVPKVTEQTLQTEGKIMRQDVTVEQVPYYETSNQKGLTAYIASEV